jgi:hypothetical protein
MRVRCGKKGQAGQAAVKLAQILHDNSHPNCMQRRKKTMTSQDICFFKKFIAKSHTKEREKKIAHIWHPFNWNMKGEELFKY